MKSGMWWLHSSTEFNVAMKLTLALSETTVDKPRIVITIDMWTVEDQVKQDYCLACMLGQYSENIFNTIRKREVLEKVNYILFVISLQYYLFSCVIESHFVSNPKAMELR